MGLFDRLSQFRPKQDDNLDSAESFAALMIAAIAADGQSEESSARLVATTLSRMKLFENYSDEKMIPLIPTKEGKNIRSDRPRSSFS